MSALTFPPPIFAAVAPASYLHAHLSTAKSTVVSPPSRPNGRGAPEFRTPAINAGSLTQCSGSAVVRLGNTAVVCGVRGEILRAEDVPNPTHNGADGVVSRGRDASELASLGLLVPNIELGSGCSAAHLPGSAPSPLAQTLAQRVRDLLLTTDLIRAEDLRIYRRVSNEHGDETDDVVSYWTLYMDILVISFDGGVFDAAWSALVAALRDVRLPHASWDADREAVVCSDRSDELHPLKLRGLPIVASFAIFESQSSPPASERDPDDEKHAWILADPDAFEEELCDERAFVVVDCGAATSVKRIEKSGGTVIGRAGMRGLVQAGERRWVEWRTALGA